LDCAAKDATLSEAEEEACSFCVVSARLCPSLSISFACQLCQAMLYL